MTTAKPNPTFPLWLRLIFLFVALQPLELIVVFFQPPLVQLLVPWTATPLNARFIAALYVSLGAGVLLCVFARKFAAVRIVLLGIGLATTILLLITIPQLGQLSPFPFWWMLFYIVDPILVILAFWRLGWRRGETPTQNAFAPIWLAFAVIMGAAGLFLLIFPSAAVAIWPWNMTQALAQLYSAFFLTLAISSYLASREAPEGARLPIVMILLLAVLVLAVSLYHLDRFKPGISSIVWFTLFGLQAVVFAVLLFLERMPVPVQGAAT